LARWAPRRGERLAPSAAALLLVLSYPPLHPLVLPFVGLVPLAVWMSGLPDGPEGAGSARRGAALFGFLYFGLMLHWVLVALLWLAPVGVLLFALGLALLTTLTAGFGHAFHYAVRGRGVPVWLALPALWTGLEWTRAHMPGTLALPWLGLGTTLTGFPELVGVAEIVGARGVTFWIALVNGLLACALLDRMGAERPKARGSRSALYVTAALLVTAAPMAWGVRRASSLETWSAGRVAILQPDVPQRIRLDTTLVRDSTLAALDRLVPLVAPSSARLAVLPEMVLPMEPESAAHAADVARLQSHAREMGTPVLFGARGRQLQNGEAGHPLNSAFLVDPQGLADYRYDKHRLVPMVERTLMLPVLPGWLRPAGDFAPGDEWSLADVDGVAYGALICFESSFADVGRALRNAGADVLVNLTNDAWFGREPAHARTVALWQHPAHLVMRAIENRVGVVRAANSGLSWVVHPSGRVVGSIGLFEEGVRVLEVETTDVTTVYARVGDLAGNTSAVVLLLTLLAAWGDARRRSRGGVPRGRLGW
jgi:apolipoprotein N-acyltransferase